jgi:NADPH-dependent 2,4-dienoyl-CoA reductase/sulfur reductase-like enzyme
MGSHLEWVHIEFIMSPNEFKQVKETDVLVIGGGLAGCMAALHAHQEGASVLIVE